MEEYILGENVKSEKKYILVILDTRVLQVVRGTGSTRLVLPG